MNLLERIRLSIGRGMEKNPQYDDASRDQAAEMIDAEINGMSNVELLESIAWTMEEDSD